MAVWTDLAGFDTLPESFKIFSIPDPPALHASGDFLFLFLFLFVALPCAAEAAIRS